MLGLNVHLPKISFYEFKSYIFFLVLNNNSAWFAHRFHIEVANEEETYRKTTPMMLIFIIYIVGTPTCWMLVIDNHKDVLTLALLIFNTHKSFSFKNIYHIFSELCASNEFAIELLLHFVSEFSSTSAYRQRGRIWRKNETHRHGESKCTLEKVEPLLLMRVQCRKKNTLSTWEFQFCPE